MPKEYKLETIQKIIDILTDKNINNFLIDSSNYLRLMMTLRDMGNILAAKSEHTFVWIDDGKNNFSITVVVKKTKE